MESRTEWRTGPNGERIEVGVVVHEGREYAAGGALVTETHAVGYPDAIMQHMRAWDGSDLGPCRVVASWGVDSWIGPRMYQIEATIEGRTYTGRGLGGGMIWRGKVKRTK